MSIVSILLNLNVRVKRLTFVIQKKPQFFEFFSCLNSSFCSLIFYWCTLRCVDESWRGDGIKFAFIRSVEEVESQWEGDREDKSGHIYAACVCVVVVRAHQLSDSWTWTSHFFMHSHSDICPDTFSTAKKKRLNSMGWAWKSVQSVLNPWKQIFWNLRERAFLLQKPKLD